MAAIDATLYGGATWSASTQDGSPSSLLLDGVNDYAETGPDAKLDLTNSFCICLRVKRNGSQSSKYLLSRLNATESDSDWALVYGYIADSVEFHGAGYTGTTNPRVGSAISIADDLWHAIAYRYDGTEWAYWLDGAKTVIDGAADFALATTGSSRGLLFGTFDGSGWYWDGQLDHCRLFGGTLPSDAELAAWTASPFTKPATAATGVWQFDEGTGTTAADSDSAPPPPSGPTVSLTASTTSIAETGGTAALIASLSATASDTVTVVVSTSGTATSGSDYSLSTTTITIASGQTSGSVSAVSINDGVYEGNETFTASITSVTGGGASSSATSQAAFTIVDDETQPSVSMSASAVAIAENGGTATVVATLSNPSFQNVTVGFGFSGSATLNADYSASTNSIIITAGNTSGSISVTAINDAIYDPGETVIVGIDSVTNGTENGNQSVSITITDDEVAPVVNLSASTTSISENLAASYVVARLDKFSALATTINFGFSGSATLNTDYSASSNSLIVAAGQTSGSISVTAIQDTTYEGNETILVGITSVTNGSSGATSSLSITLAEDDPVPPAVSLTTSLTSIDENAGSAIVRALMSATHSATVTVTLGFAGTATNTTDYTRTTDTIVMTSGQTSGSIGITSIQDVLSESNETIVVSIASITSGISSSSDTITITIVNEGIVTNEVGMEHTKRSLIAKNAPPIEAVVSCGVVSDWIDICIAPEATDNSGSTVVNPGSISRSDQNWKALCAFGSQLLVRLKYDASVTLPTSPVVQLFGKDSAGIVSPLVDGSGTHPQTLTIDLTNDVTDGSYKYTSAKAMNIAGCKDVLAAIKTAFAGTGTVNNSAIQVRVI